MALTATPRQVAPPATIAPVLPSPVFTSIAWQLIDPHLYADHLKHPVFREPSSGSGVRALWFQDDSPLATGELVVQVDASGELLWFQLSHTRWPHGHEHLAEWRRGGGLRVGEVQGDDDRSPYRNMTPTVRYFSQPDAKLSSELIDYFVPHSTVLESSLREAIARELWRGLLVEDAAGEAAE